MILFPDDVQFHEDIRLLIYRPCGMLNEQSVDKIVRIIENLESELHEPFNRFFDTSGHDEVELNFRYVIQISLYRVMSYLDRPPVKSAILATDSTIMHYCQLHAIITEDSPIKVRIFQELGELHNGSAFPRKGSRPNRSQPKMRPNCRTEEHLLLNNNEVAARC